MIAVPGISFPQYDRTIRARTQIPNCSPRVGITAGTGVGVCPQELLYAGKATAVWEISVGEMVAVPVQRLFKLWMTCQLKLTL